MKWTAFLMVAGLTACGLATPHFRSAQSARVTVDGSTFDVRRRGDVAEAIRVNSEYAPRNGPIEGRAVQAIRMVSGCGVRWVSGDQAVLLAQLDC